MRRSLGVLAVAAALCAASTASAGTTFVVDGGGWGHGVGMSQYGALGFASHGWGYGRILGHYYRGTRLGILPNRTVRVLVFEGRGRVLVGSAKPFRRVARGRKVTLKRGDRGVNVRGVRRLGGAIRYEPGASPLRVEGDPYRGTVTIFAEGGRLLVVNTLSLDHYLRGVVPWEMPDHWPLEALKAQAVVARSYTLATLHAQSRFDLYPDTRDQVYGGIRAEDPRTNRAVAETAGRIVMYGGRVAITYYHSTSGGRTAAIHDVWPKAAPTPYLVSVSDPYDYLSKHHRWPVVVLSRSQLAFRLKAPGLTDVVVDRNSSGRADVVRLLRRQGERQLSAQEVREILGLRSTNFSVRVLSLDASSRLVRPGKPVELTGFVRGLGRIRLEREVGRGAWETVRRVRLAPNGRFHTVVRPETRTRYRLANHIAVGDAIAVATR
jgi:stage II sporulation protein D